MDYTVGLKAGFKKKTRAHSTIAFIGISDKSPQKFNLPRLMLKGISPLLSPDLLAVLYRMGHGDEIVLADAHFPGDTFNQSVLRADGLRIPDLLDGILPLFELDAYVPDPLVMMAPVVGDTLDPEVETAYRRVIEKHVHGGSPISRIERFAFYERARNAFAVLMTGETAKYGNLILKKGVTPCAS